MFKILEVCYDFSCLPSSLGWRDKNSQCSKLLYPDARNRPNSDQISDACQHVCDPNRSMASFAPIIHLTIGKQRTRSPLISCLAVSATIRSFRGLLSERAVFCIPHASFSYMRLLPPLLPIGPWCFLMINGEGESEKISDGSVALGTFFFSSSFPLSLSVLKGWSDILSRLLVQAVVCVCVCVYMAALRGSNHTNWGMNIINHSSVLCRLCTALAGSFMIICVILTLSPLPAPRC